METHQPGARYHALDALRALMMLLGIYLHAAVAYSEHGSWPWKDGSTTRVFDVSLGLVHAFRMPIFYVMAGFFAMVLLERQGTVGFVRNRLLRIVLPFAAGWTVLFPLVAVLARAGMSLDESQDFPGNALRYFSSGEALHRLDPMHLWFLEYLVMFYAVAIALIPLPRTLPALLSAVDRMFRAIVISPLAPVALGTITFPTLCLMHDGAIDDPSGFLPDARIAIAYFVFFGGGWLLRRNMDLLPLLRRSLRAWICLALAPGMALTGYFIWHQGQMSDQRLLFETLASAWCLSVSMWLFVLGFVGVFLRHIRRPISWVRYLADSSYWLYLVHMPALLGFQILVFGTGWSPILKMLFVLSASIVTLLASYHLLVRSTWIGAVLNGRRHPTGRLRVIGRHAKDDSAVSRSHA